MSFTLYDKYHQKFEAVPGEGDSIKISAVQEEYEYKGVKKKRLVLNFELVE